MSVIICETNLPQFERSLEESLNRTLGCHLKPSQKSRGDALRQLGASLQPFDVIEDKDKYELITDAPGMSVEDLVIELHDGVLKVSGSRKAPHNGAASENSGASKQGAASTEQPQPRMLRSERKSFQFTRSFVVPANTTEKNISASLDKGVLKVIVAKIPEPPKPEPRRIMVHVASAK